ncbi:putative sensory transduction regulator [Nocardioides sp. J9]|uniref:T3SS (YopN, CesT) and YbjN peptide-binding chaperone 1 n=1 Tax=unclassified Nocardioides TaxID=2615069 RepID=UPI00048C56B0|nr:MULTISPECIES: YbjN domain-containing protein [unclassified Nocardioides]TWH01493.1 putative sensory transduction regulator [Nocardioides sp. J9]
MSRDMVDAYVERLLEEFTGNESLSKDDHGGYPFRHGNSAYTVRVVGNDDRPAVRVWSVALHEVDESPELLGVLNEINQRLLHARVYWADKAVVFEDALAGLTLNKGTLESSLVDVAEASNFFGPRLKEQFGGGLTFEDDPAEEAADPTAEPAAGDGLYL